MTAPSPLQESYGSGLGSGNANQMGLGADDQPLHSQLLFGRLPRTQMEKSWPKSLRGGGAVPSPAGAEVTGHKTTVPSPCSIWGP